MATVQTNNSESAIWNRLFQSAENKMSLEAARSILRLEFTQEDKDRMHELAAKARDGSLSALEAAEIRSYERTGNVLALWKSKARQRLKRVPHSNGANK